MVGGCCELSTSVHHLVDKLGVELGYRMSEDTGYDVEDCITCATKGLKLRVGEVMSLSIVSGFGSDGRPTKSDSLNPLPSHILSLHSMHAFSGLSRSGKETGPAALAAAPDLPPSALACMYPHSGTLPALHLSSSSHLLVG